MKKQLSNIFGQIIFTVLVIGTISVFAQENENLKRGKELFDAEKYDEAIAVLNKCAVVADKQIKGECLIARGEAFAKKFSSQKAVADFTAAILLNPKDDKSYFARARFYYRDEQSRKALPDFNKAIALNPTNAEAFYLRGIVLGDYDDKQKPIDDFTMVIKLNPGYSNAYLMRAYSYNEVEKFNLTIADFNKYLELDPNSDEAFYQRGKTYQASGNKEKAAADFRKAIEMQNDIPPYKEALADINLSKEEVVKKAEDIAKKENLYTVLEFLDDYPEYANDPEILYLKSVTNVEAGKFKKADVYFQKQFDNFYKDALSSIAAGDDYAKKEKSAENYEMTSLMYGTALVSFGSADLVNALRAVATERNGLPAIKRNPKNLNGHAEFKKLYEEIAVKAGNVELDAEKFDLALQNFNKAIELNPRSKAALEGRAKVYRKQGKIRLAVSDESKAKLLTVKK